MARRQAEADAAWAAYREADAAASSRGRIVSGLDRLDALEPEGWGQLVRDVVEAVEVTRGRGPVEERVRVFVRGVAAPELPELREDAGTVVGELPEVTDADAPETVI
jgi:hypothetical protein